MKKFILCNCLAVVIAGALPVMAQELIKEGNFEALRGDKMPDGPPWAWRNGGSKELKIELSTTEKNGGNSSLHITDLDRGNSNDGLTWMMAGNEIPRWTGKTLRLSCRIKQVKATSAKSVGIGYWIKQKNGKSLAAFAGPESAGETVWSEYSLQFTLPTDAEVLLVFLHCANGWGNDAEAFFDDLSLTPAVAGAVVAEVKKPAPAIDINAGQAFYLFHDAALPLWQKREWGGLYIEQNRASAGQGESGMKIATVKGSTPYAGVGLLCPFANRMADLSAAPGDAVLFFMVKPFYPMQVQFAQKNIPVTDAMKSTLADGWTLVKMPLSSFWNNGKPGPVNSINFQFTGALSAGSIMLLDEIGITGLANQVDTKAMDAAIQANADRLCQGLDRIWTSDQYQRPESRNGTFYYNGKPSFMLGPWIDDMLLISDFGPGTSRECARGTIYDQLYGPKVAAELGMNSFQLSAAVRLPFLRKLSLPWEKRQIDDAEVLQKMFRGLNGMPFIQDYAWINWTASSLKTENPANVELMQKNTEWHEFIPYCPEHPRAIEIYSAYYRTGAAFALANGANPFIHEIFNESSYHCSCKFNRENFARQMEMMFKDIDAANRAWHTSFRSFNELAVIPRFETYPAIWSEWCKFQAQRYASVLRDFGREIKKVDQRPNVYLTEQLSVSSLFIPRGATMDYRLIAKELDVLTTEGGWHFGQAKTAGNNPMEDAMMSSGYPFVADLFSALSQGKKPIVNNEHYCVRTSFGKRVPSKKEDLVTAMWAEVFHDVSGSFPYAWCKRVWEWKNLDEAKAQVYNGGYKASNMLNPYSWPRPALDGFKEFSAEAGRLAEIVMPQPRRAPAKVALVYSYPSLRQSALNQENIEKQLLNCYFSMLYSQYPPEIVFAEDMTAESLRRFDAVVLPAIRNASQNVVAALQAYASAGGLVICAGNALSENEYSQPLDASALLGVQRHDRKIQPGSAVAVGKGWQNRIGKGNVYYLEKTFADPATAGNIPEILARHQTERYFSVQPLDGKPLAQAELQLIDRGNVKLMLLVNWEDRGSRLVRVQYTGKNKLTAMHLSSPVKHELLVNGNSSAWDEKALREGVTVLLPPQTRTLLLFSSELPSDATRRINAEQVKDQFKAALEMEAGEQAAVNRREAELTRESYEARNYTEVKVAACVPLDLSRQANTGFRDELAGDKLGGWFDQGGNDYRQMPVGLVSLAGGVPFKIIDPAKNNDRAAIALRGTERPYFAAGVSGIEVGDKISRLYVLHTAGWEQAAGGACYYLKINYADNSSARIPAAFEEAIGGWWNPKPLPEAKIAHESENMSCKRIGLYCWRLNNPHPEKMVKSLELEAGKGNAIPIIVAITAEK